MADALKIDRELVKADYVQGMKQKLICEKYGISHNTLKTWIKRYHWKLEKEPSESQYKEYLLSKYSYKQLYEIVKTCMKNDDR